MVEQLIPNLSALFSHFGGETVLALAIPGVILADLFAGPARREKVATWVGLGALVVAFLLVLLQPHATDATLTRMLRADGLARTFRLLAIGTGIVASIAALRGRDLPRARTEFFVLLFGAVLGACLTAAANDLAMLYVAIETLSIAGYLLAGFRKENPKGAEAALKYVIFGAVASGAMLYGMSLLYGFAGTTTITTVTIDGVTYHSLMDEATKAASEPAFLIAILMTFAGFAYKIAAAPFQFWCPDVYEGSPTSVAAFLAVASKGAGFAAILRVVYAVSDGGAIMLHGDTMRMVLVGVAVVTMSIANVAALRQTNAKRLLAYSAIAHAGVLLLGVAVTTAAGASAVVFYMIVYLFMTLGAFYMVGLVERETGRGDLDAFEGLGFRAPAFAVCMSICLIALTGLPPTGGFVSKFFIFREVFAYAGEHSSGFFFWCGVIALLNTAVSLYYYAGIMRRMYLCDMDRVPKTSFSFAGIDKGVVLLMTAPVLLLGIAFGGVYAWAEHLIDSFWKTASLFLS